MPADTPTPAPLDVTRGRLLAQIARDKAAFEALSPGMQKSMLNELRSMWGPHLLTSASQSPPASPDGVVELVGRLAAYCENGENPGACLPSSPCPVCQAAAALSATTPPTAQAASPSPDASPDDVVGLIAWMRERSLDFRTLGAGLACQAAYRAWRDAADELEKRLSRPASDKVAPAAVEGEGLAKELERRSAALLYTGERPSDEAIYSVMMRAAGALRHKAGEQPALSGDGEGR